MNLYKRSSRSIPPEQLKRLDCRRYSQHYVRPQLALPALPGASEASRVLSDFSERWITTLDILHQQHWLFCINNTGCFASTIAYHSENSSCFLLNQCNTWKDVSMTLSFPPKQVAFLVQPWQNSSVGVDYRTVPLFCKKKEAGTDNDPFAVSLAVGPRRRYEDYLSAFELVDPDFALALGSQAWPYLTSLGPAPKPEVPWCYPTCFVYLVFLNLGQNSTCIFLGEGKLEIRGKDRKSTLHVFFLWNWSCCRCKMLKCYHSIRAIQRRLQQRQALQWSDEVAKRRGIQQIKGEIACIISLYHTNKMHVYTSKPFPILEFMKCLMLDTIY